MTETAQPGKLRQAGHSLVEWAKIVSALLVLASFGGGTYVATKQGIGTAVRSISGFDDAFSDFTTSQESKFEEFRNEQSIHLAALRSENVNLQDEIETLISYIEPPKVVIWERIRQLGSCTYIDCAFDISFFRTAFGEDCGVPTVVAEMRLNEGLPFTIGLGNFQPIEGQVQGSRVTVPVVFSRRIPEGFYEWRVINEYPSCNFPGEPLPRRSPWWPIHVTQPTN